MNILVAEDSKTSMAMMVALLNKLGHEVTQATDGEMALEILCSEKPPPLAILDWMMPKMTGVEVINQLRKTKSSVYTIMLTSRTEEGALVEALDGGANDYIAKPFNPLELRARIDAGIRMIQSERALREARNKMAEFVGIVSHDLRSPVGTSISIVNLMESDAENIKQCLPLLRTCCERSLNIITKLLDITAMDLSRITLELQNQSLRPVIEDAFALCRDKAQTKGVELIQSLCDDDEVYIDPHRIAQVIDNLLTNAIKFTPKGGQVTLTTHRGEDRLFVEVSDSGTGVLSAYLPHLFDKEIKTSTRGTDDESGTGFGLPLSQEIIMGHGGEILVQNLPEGGASFHFELPLEKG